MAIITKENQFHLQANNISYVVGIYQNTYPVQLYWGKRITEDTDLTFFMEEEVSDRAAGLHQVVDEDKHLFLSDVALEFSTVSNGLYRTPTVHAKFANGSTYSEFQYVDYKIYDGKEKLAGLPAVYAENAKEAQTLELCFEDKIGGLRAYLVYTVFPAYDIITRNIRYENVSKDMICLLSAQSATVDLYAPDYELLHMHGDWLREGTVERAKLDHNRVVVESKRGTSSAMAQPFAALVAPGATEETGEVYAFSFVYSGSFQIEAERTSTGFTRMNVGLQSFDFGWELQSGETFQTPEVVMVYSDAGIGKMSRQYHKIYRERLCRGTFRDEDRPIVINHWDATGPRFTEKQLEEIAAAGAEIGTELFVMDDGWFGEDPIIRPLGDWYPNPQKFPAGIKGMVDRINQSGMRFGIWFEPEVVSPKSNLYQAHPDWCMQTEGYNPVEMFHQYLLDFSKPEVQEYIINSISAILESANITYVKWDFNRHYIEAKNQMHKHQCVLGLYKVLDTLTEKYPYVLFEGCASGGSRFDPGMLYYMPQTWTSDNQKAMCRDRIQYGMSMVCPPISISAHAGQIPIGLEGHNDHFQTSAMVSMSGNFGYEMDLSKLSKTEMEQAKEYLNTYKRIRHTVQFGDLYRIGNPFTDDRTAREFVSENQAVILTYQRTAQLNGEEWRIRMHGLDPKAVYSYNGKEYTGEVLMNLGVRIMLEGFDTYCGCHIFEKVQ